MSLPRALARLLAVAIVMIAACVGASVAGATAAQAHQGHAHHATPAPAPAPTLAEARAAADGPRLTVARDDEATPARPCNGLCCATGASCCAPGLLPDALAAVPALTPARRLTATEDALPVGIVPDSPARPPRPFA
ncbi:hypothetical protein [Methylobacterium platani]|uniref:Uncharacterized protein n=2 Tax=Methylobacterium platani TaxID=427683 RepID=A0A179S589_9HYPH|nr:hypothetical protein [Methylobacterium platani]KMO15757.1 hypothetical protein SQ03_16505 [Methylobacterium platani JCM 14648]OAS19564.1 hypothetical protein A5481_24420 [Methylobacterium platani]